MKKITYYALMPLFIGLLINSIWSFAQISGGGVEGGSTRPQGSNFATQVKSGNNLFGVGPGVVGQLYASKGASASPIFEPDLVFDDVNNALVVGEAANPGSIKTPNDTDLSILAGDGHANNIPAGSIIIQAGTGGGGSGPGGNVVLTAGQAGPGGSVGSILFTIAGTQAAKIDTNRNNIVLAGRGATGGSYQTPTTGFTITIGDNTVFLTLDPAGTLATGTVNMPATPFDGEEVEVESTQTVTALTVAAPGKTIRNTPATIAAGTGFGYRYRLSNTTWYRRY